MTIVSLVAALLGFLGIPFFVRRPSIAYIGIAYLLGLVHIATTLIYFQYTRSSVADTYFYYYGEYYFSKYAWTSLSTIFVGHLTQAIKSQFGATYLDCFMVFQVFGIWGIMILLRTFYEIQQKTRLESIVPYYLLFIPSVHFWTVSIGKDAPLFFAVSLCTWSVLNLSKRIVTFFISIGVMVLFRAHIALAAVISLAVASIIQSRFSIGRRFALFVFALIGAILLLSTVQTSFGVDVSDPTSVGRFFEMRGAVEAADTGATSFAHASFLFRLFSLLFRPFFFDVRNPLGFVASIENVGNVIMLLYLFSSFRTVIMLMRQVFFISFVVVFSLVVIVIISMLNFNVGLGLRERVMVIPPLFCLLIATIATRRLQSAAAQRRFVPVVAEPRPVTAPDHLPSG